MRIISLDFEVVRATPTVAEFLAHVTLDEPAAGCEFAGRVVGPCCAGVSTVEVAYLMRVVEVGEKTATMRCVIPEPNLWTPEAPFTYAATVELMANDESLDARSSNVAIRASTEV
jgi:hypothetical protein